MQQTPQHYILGTAGHVDHGKTELVKALTGWDTDRLKEEKDRGISIELGFAPLEIDDATFIGIVDVPGHERFVKNMVAGAGGIDMAMLLVAADEGVMPQSKEHLEVLRSLGISAGVVVISKLDLVDDEMIEVLRDEIGDLVAGSFLEGAPVVGTSAKTGTGIDELRGTLKALAGTLPPRDAGGPFRLPVDRVFHRKGIGVVVTGSCYSGTVSVGDSLELLPAGKSVRVRELQSFLQRREVGFAGERLAIALQGVKIGDVARGEMLVTPSKFAVADRLDVRLRVADYTDFELKQRERIRIHHGAREVLGRVIILEGDRLRSGENALAQLKLEKPVVAAEGDCFVVRKYSPARVLGGGRIIDPNAEKHRLRDQTAVGNLMVRERGRPEDKLRSELLAAGLEGLQTDRAGEEGLAMLEETGTVVAIDKRLFHNDVLAALAERVHELASRYNHAHPLRYGIDKEELRQKIGFPHSTAFFNRVLERLSRLKPLYVRDNRVRADTEEVRLSPALKDDLATLERTMKERGLLFFRYAEMEAQWKADTPLADALQYLRDSGVVVRLANDGYIHKAALESCIRGLEGLFNEKPSISVSDFKDLFGLTRKHAIPLLEHLDAAKVTARQGNSRVKGPRFGEALGKRPDCTG